MLTVLRPTPLALILLGVVLAAVAAVPIPAMVDYVNHLARMELLADPRPDAAYVTNWQLVPNLAMDLVVPALARLMTVVVAARLFFAAALALLVTGAMALERAVVGRHRFAGLCALAVLFSQPIAWGLVNFTFGLGLALWGMALWIASTGRPWPVRWALHAAVSLALFVAHFLALGFYGVVIGLVSFAPLLQGRMRVVEAAGLTALLASPVVALIGIMAASGGTIGGTAIDWDFPLKLSWFATFMNIYAPPVGVALAAVVGALIIWLAFRRELVLTSTGQLVAAGLLLLYLALPRQLFDIAYLDVRVLTLAALVLPAFVMVQPSRGAAAVLVAVAIVNGMVTLSAWASHQRDYAEFRHSFEWLAPGSAVLLAQGAIDPVLDPPLFYAATLAVPARRVFVASFYAVPGVQPVIAVPRFGDLAPRRGLDHLPVPLAQLAADRGPAHTRGWRCRFAYLYVLGAPVPPLPGLVPLARGRRFVLYRVVAPPVCGSAQRKNALEPIAR